jgi:molecular chaperone Hsp33
MSSTDSDSLRQFHFEHSRVRGQIVRLESSLGEVLGQHHYPEMVAQLLGETLAAVVLLGATLKFSGTLSLQAKSEGPVGLLFAEVDHLHRVRGYARVRRGAGAGGSVDKLLREGTLAITISPEQGQQYQGIVPLDAPTLGPCLEHYFAQSEQLPCVIHLACDGQRAAGLLLQSLPQQDGTPADPERWEHLRTLAATTQPAELLHDPFETLLYHLFHQERVRLHREQQVQFGCRCSPERAAKTLLSIGESEARSVLEEQGLVRIQCEFCQQEYRFDAASLDALFGPAASASVH